MGTGCCAGEEPEILGLLGITDAPRHPAAEGRHRIWHLLMLLWLPSPFLLTQRAMAPLSGGTREAAVATVSAGPVVHAADSARCPPWPASAGTCGLREPRLTSSVIWPPKVTHVPGRRHMGSSQRTSPGSLPSCPHTQGALPSGCRAWGTATGHHATRSAVSPSSARGDTRPSRQGQVSLS